MYGSYWKWGIFQCHISLLECTWFSFSFDYPSLATSINPQHRGLLTATDHAGEKAFACREKLHKFLRCCAFEHGVISKSWEMSNGNINETHLIGGTPWETPFSGRNFWKGTWLSFKTGCARTCILNTLVPMSLCKQSSCFKALSQRCLGLWDTVSSI